MAINNVYITVTGDCQNSSLGAYSLSIDGNSPDYRLEFTYPSVPASYICNGCTTAGSYIYLGPAETSFLAYNLSAGTYNITVWDSETPTNNSYSVGINISSGTCISVDSVIPTSCGLDNGSVTASTSTNYNTFKNFYLYDDIDSLITSSTTQITTFFYNNQLSAGTYYFVGDDGSGCTGRSESFVVKSSSTLSYSLYTVDNSSCSVNLGKIFVSGLTGVYPFTYSWSNGETGVDNITGLTSGSYSVTVTDGNGCSITKSTTIDTADPLTLITFTFNPPSCSNNDGEITVYYNGGSAPYIIQCSNGDYQVLFDTEYTFQNLPSGIYTFTIVDAGLCTVNGNFTLIPPNSFVVQSVNITNANCFGNNGSLFFNLLGAAGSYDYELVGTTSTTNGNFILSNGGNYSYTISNLIPDTYSITITSTTSPCIFTNTYTIGNTTPFTISTSTTGSTCGYNNGVAEISVSQGYSPNLKFTLISNTINNGQTQTTPNSATTFYNLQAGNYQVTVQDLNGLGCTAVSSFTLPQTSTSLDFLPLIVNGDEITVSITQGQPPFAIYWSGSSGYLTQTGTTATGLTPGYYNVTVYDNNGCFKKSETVQVVTTTTSSFSQSYGVCDTTLGSTVIPIPKKLSQIFFDGYVSAISANTGCDLYQGIFTSNVYVNSTLYQDSFFTANTLNDVLSMSDNLWYDSIKDVLMSVYGIGEVVIDVLNNQITINTDCNLPGNILAGAQILIDVQVDYEINCRFCTARFENCDDPTDEITFGIVSSNFSVGDVIKYNNTCYQLNSNSPVGLAITNRNEPDFIGGTACADCLSTL